MFKIWFRINAPCCLQQYLCNKGSCEDNHIFWIYFLSVVGCPLVKKRKKSQDNSLSKVPKQDEKIVAVKSDSIK